VQRHGVTKTGAKSAGRTKMTRSVSSMMDVGRHDFGAAIERSGAANVVRIVLRDSLKRAGLAEFTLVVGRAISVRVDSRAGENPLSIAQLWPMGGTGPSDGEDVRI
jgi:hypothetical protein